jgi:hypothetical protein
MAGPNVQPYDLTVSSTTLTVVRAGRRSHLKDGSSAHPLAHHLAGQLPYFYREPGKLAKEFAEEMARRRNALDLLYDLTIKMPTTPKFQQSHCGEILSALFLEEVLGLRRLMCKLTLTTAENTNVHKMDGFFVDTTKEPFTFYAVEAKSSILPTAETSAKGHRYGILRQLIGSLENYGAVDERFDFTTVRDNLEAVVVWLFFHLFVVFYEEPTLRQKFGESYEEYCKTVPRWIPCAPADSSIT